MPETRDVSQAGGAGTGTRRRRSRRGEGERLREEIIAAAESLLTETGDETAVSVRAVAERVGVSAPAIYLHFADREALITAVCEQHFAALGRETDRAAAGIGDPVDELRERGRAYVRFGVDHPEQYRILFMRRAEGAPGDFDVQRMLSTASFDRIVQVVERALAAGAVHGPDAFTVATELWVVVHGVTSLLISKPWFPWPDRDAFVDRVIDHHLAGLAAPSDPAEPPC